MDIDYENDEGVKLFIQIVDYEERKKNNNQEFSDNQNLQVDTKIENILIIAFGLNYKRIVYITDDEIEKDNADPERQKIAFETISKREVQKIIMMKDYFSTKNLKPLQDYWDALNIK